MKLPCEALYGASCASVPRAHAPLTTGGGVQTALRERPNGFLHTPIRPSKIAPSVGPEQPFSYYLEIYVQKFIRRPLMGLENAVIKGLHSAPNFFRPA
jgi:hypothetical protein